MATDISNAHLKHKDQRVGVFIDVQNMYYSAKALYTRKVNFGEILNTAVSDRRLIRALAYVVRATGEESSFFEALNQRGIETKVRDLQEFHGGVKKADWDVGITVDAIRIGEILDVVVIVSGDGDFVELVEYLRHHGKQVEIIAFKQSTSSKLINAADDFTDLSLDTDKYLIGPKTARTDGKKPLLANYLGKKSTVGEEDKKYEVPSDSDSGQFESFWIKPPGEIDSADDDSENI